MALVREKVKAANPKVSFGTYTELGIRLTMKWELISPAKYDPAQDFNWATPEYKNCGYAELIVL
ncbi:hypothetical protein NXW94_30205 [Bacteroides ovatus]|nr:hypothetical protein [Bacteroides ovatus]